jgi:hypothetical protein
LFGRQFDGAGLRHLHWRALRLGKLLSLGLCGLGLGDLDFCDWLFLIDRLCLGAGCNS